jgi:hypothetical protein
LLTLVRDRGDLPAALERYCAAHAIAERLAKAGPNNTLWQQRLCASHRGIGDVACAFLIAAVAAERELA